MCVLTSSQLCSTLHELLERVSAIRSFSHKPHCQTRWSHHRHHTARHSFSILWRNRWFWRQLLKRNYFGFCGGGVPSVGSTCLGHSVAFDFALRGISRGIPHRACFHAAQESQGQRDLLDPPRAASSQSARWDGEVRSPSTKRLYSLCVGRKWRGSPYGGQPWDPHTQRGRLTAFAPSFSCQ